MRSGYIKASRRRNASGFWSDGYAMCQGRNRGSGIQVDACGPGDQEVPFGDRPHPAEGCSRVSGRSCLDQLRTWMVKGS